MPQSATLDRPTGLDSRPTIVCVECKFTVDAETESAACNGCQAVTCTYCLVACAACPGPCDTVENGLCDACRSEGIVDCGEWA